MKGQFYRGWERINTVVSIHVIDRTFQLSDRKSAAVYVIMNAVMFINPAVFVFSSKNDEEEQRPIVEKVSFERVTSGKNKAGIKKLANDLSVHYFAVLFGESALELQRTHSSFGYP